jgi:squalene synthase HpnC
MTPSGTIGDREADAAFEYCARITSRHYENFPVASLFLPEEKRPYIQAVYAFSRGADDLADEGDVPAPERLAHLADWERRLDRSYEGEADHPVFIALAETVRRNRIPKEYLAALLSAFRQDVVKKRYDTMEDLLDYCSRSANPVGRIVLHIFGHRDEALSLLSDRICTGLQLTNFWQDLGSDLAKDRLYIPRTVMERHSYTEEEWARRVVNDNFRSMMEHLVTATRGMFREGARLPDLAEKDIALELRLVWLGGMAILRAIERSGYDVYTSRPALGALEKAGIVFRGFFMKDLSRLGLPRKAKKPWDLT